MARRKIPRKNSLIPAADQAAEKNAKEQATITDEEEDDLVTPPAKKTRSKTPRAKQAAPDQEEQNTRPAAGTRGGRRRGAGRGRGGGRSGEERPREQLDEDESPSGIQQSEDVDATPQLHPSSETPSRGRGGRGSGRGRGVGRGRGRGRGGGGGRGGRLPTTQQPPDSSPLSSPERDSSPPKSTQREARASGRATGDRESSSEKHITRSLEDKEGRASDEVLSQDGPRPQPRAQNRANARTNRKRTTSEGNGDVLEQEQVDAFASLERNLDELTKKLSRAESHYQELRDVGIVEANENVKKFRAESEKVAKASTKTIEYLQRELATKRSEVLQSGNRQREERDSEVSDLHKQLEQMRTENATLQTKLAAARKTPDPVVVPGSALKAGVSREAATKSAESQRAAQLKEELYADLTGLIIRNVKKREADYLYDCIQTGRNGTLHFKLAIAHEKDTAAPSSQDAAEFFYMPHLYEDRDRDLMALLPDYLSIGITFSRQHAPEFFRRVVDTLTKKRTDE